MLHLYTKLVYLRTPLIFIIFNNFEGAKGWCNVIGEKNVILWAESGMQTQLLIIYP